jgi:hypothetical protein
MPLALADSETSVTSVAQSNCVVLSGHTSLETAYIQGDYPYGRRLRCQRKVWIETATKGSAKGKMRFVAQTSNPKRTTLSWNKPHAGQYRDFMLMYINPENDHIETVGIDIYSVEEVKAFKAQWYDLLNEEQKAKLDEVERKTVAINSYWTQKTNLVAAAN